MLASIKEIMCSDILIDPNNIYIITGLSCVEWKQQTKNRLPSKLSKNVFHRADLPKDFIKDLRDKKNVIIIIDECHLASITKQTISSVFNEFGLLELKFLLGNDIKIMEFTATPDGTIYDLLKWGEHSVKILSKEGECYTGANDLLEMGRVKQYKELFVSDEGHYLIADNILELANTIKSFPICKYHIIRIKAVEHNGLELLKEALMDMCGLKLNLFD
jgi:hypothetical protein